MIDSDPAGITFIDVLLVSYPVPPEIILTLVIFPSETTDSSLANPPTSSRLFHQLQQLQVLEVLYNQNQSLIYQHSVIFPSDIIGTMNPSLPVSKVFILGLRR